MRLSVFDSKEKFENKIVKIRREPADPKKKKNQVEKETISSNHERKNNERKSRSSILINLDDFLKSFSLSYIVENQNNSEFSQFSNEIRYLNNLDEILELNRERRNLLYEYLNDFLVFDLDDNEKENCNMILIDNETEKSKRELNDIPQLYKQKYRNAIGKRECEFLQVVKMNEFEKVKIDYDFYPDDYPLLDVRKYVKLVYK